MRYAILLLLAAPACVGQPDISDQGPAPRTDGLQALYTFEEGDGIVVHDVSGVEPAFDLQLDSLVTNRWVPGGGVELVGPSVITSPEVAAKIFVECVRANAVSIELWVEPATDAQTGPATLLTYGKGNGRNVTVQQDGRRYRGAVSTSNPDPMATTGLVQTVQTPDELAAATIQHVVYVRDAAGATVYVDGVDAVPPPATPPITPPPATDQTTWSPTFQLALGNEAGGGRPWLGKLYRVAVYSKRLTAEEVAAKYQAGW